MKQMHNDQRGLVSLIVVVILMAIITIITLSFSNIVRNEQRQSLDRQLSTQAQYAAESGINYATKIIGDNIAASPNASLQPLIKNDCGPNGSYSQTLQFEPGVTTSCLLVDTNPRTLVYDLSTANLSKVFPVRPILSPTDTVNMILVEWSPQSGNANTCPNNSTVNTLDPASHWQCPFAVLRVDLSNTSKSFAPAATDTRRALAENTFAGVFMPTRPGVSTGNVNFSASRNAFSGNTGTGSQGVRYAANCTSDVCRMTIALGSSNEEYFMRISSLYRDTKVSISMPNTAGVKVGLKDAQVVVDATGKAQDVLKRVQVRLPLSGNGTHADYGLQAKDTICKAFSAFPGRRNDVCTP